jgi:hypothetical protein
MNIYALKREKGVKADEMTAFVVIAETELGARKLAAQSAGDEGAYPWAFEATAVKVGTAESGIMTGVLLGSFNAG